MCRAASGGNLGEATSIADLGDSSNCLNENIEDCGGEGPHVNSIWTWVSRTLNSDSLNKALAFVLTCNGANIRQPGRGYCMVT